MERDVVEKVLEVSRRMAETREVGPMLHYAVGEAMQLVNAERGYLVLLDDVQGLFFRVMRDRVGNVLTHPHEEVSTTILSKAIDEGEPVFIVDAIADPQFLRASSVTSLQLRSVMCVPLISRGTTIGAMYVENRSAGAVFRPTDLTPLTIFANHAAVLIENAMLYETLELRVEERTRELNLALNEAEHSWQEAVKANAMRTGFLANMTHDMRLPLSVAMGAASMIEDETFGPLNSDQKEWMGKIMESLRHTVQLTDDLFHIARYTEQEDTDPLSFMPEQVNLYSFLKKIAGIGKALPWVKGVTFKFEADENLPDVSIDSIRIRQVIFNLLSNALKFTEKGEVLLYAQLHNEYAIIGVRDTGPGIPSDKLEVIFKRFQQLDQTAQQRRSGGGLGLAISRALVEMHNGQIWAENVPSGGSDFKIALPLA